MSRTILPVVLLAGILTACGRGADAPQTNVRQGDWPQWRGPNRDGISTETGLLKEWEQGGPPLAWQVEGLGSGWGSVSVAGGRIFVMGNREGGEHVTALRVDDGARLWSTKVGTGGHSNCAPTVDGDRVYAVGLDGDLACLDVDTGEVVWSKNYGRDFKGRMMSSWGFSESPLVDGDRLICTPGARDAILAALDKRDGSVIWKTTLPGGVGRRGGDGAAYSSVVVSNGAGVKQYVQLVGRGVIGVRADDGKLLWAYNRIANDTANIPTPIVHGDYVFTSTGYGTGAALLKLSPDGDGVKAEEVYFLDQDVMQNHHGGMILLDDHVYCGTGHNNGFPLCIELLTGKVAWRADEGPGRNSAAIAYADGNLYFRYQNGTMALIEANPMEYVVKGSFRLASINGESWPHPVIAGGRLYLRDQNVLMCYDIRERRD
jgi:outer membrane protein assembly factor BamB